MSGKKTKIKLVDRFYKRKLLGRELYVWEFKALMVFGPGFFLSLFLRELSLRYFAGCSNVYCEIILLQKNYPLVLAFINGLILFFLATTFIWAILKSLLGIAAGKIYGWAPWLSNKDTPVIKQGNCVRVLSFVSLIGFLATFYYLTSLIFSIIVNYYLYLLNS